MKSYCYIINQNVLEQKLYKVGKIKPCTTTSIIDAANYCRDQYTRSLGRNLIVSIFESANSNMDEILIFEKLQAENMHSSGEIFIGPRNKISYICKEITGSKEYSFIFTEAIIKIKEDHYTEPNHNIFVKKQLISEKKQPLIDFDKVNLDMLKDNQKNTEIIKGKNLHEILIRVMEYIFCNPDYPENYIFSVDHKKNFIKVFQDNEWIICEIEYTISLLFNYTYEQFKKLVKNVTLTNYELEIILKSVNWIKKVFDRGNNTRNILIKHFCERMSSHN